MNNYFEDDESEDEVSQDELQEEINESIDEYIYNEIGGANTTAERMKYHPEEYNKKLPKKGGWIMVIMDIPTTAKPIKYSAYFAVPAPLKKTIQLKYGFHRNQKADVPYYRVRIQTQEGEVHLWPHEYIYIKESAILTEEVGNSFDMIKMGGDTNYDTAKVHYLKTRGIPESLTYELLLSGVNSINHVYFKIRPEAVPFWEFYIDALQKGIRPEFALVLWERQQSGKPLFNVQTVDEHGHPSK